MKLKLMWVDVRDNIYELGILENKEGTYYFNIEYENLKQATRNGCMGIGSMNLLNTNFESDSLFPFFKNRIPRKDNPRINEYLEEFGLKEYDEMELLKATKAMLATDRYYIQELYK